MPGPANYESPWGTVSGTLERKRQFRIRESKLEFDLEPDVQFVDDLLQDELSRASSEDEMQDYSPVQYAVLGKIFRCRKTVLGDASQTVSAGEPVASMQSAAASASDSVSS